MNISPISNNNKTSFNGVARLKLPYSIDYEESFKWNTYFAFKRILGKKNKVVFPRFPGYEQVKNVMNEKGLTNPAWLLQHINMQLSKPVLNLKATQFVNKTEYPEVLVLTGPEAQKYKSEEKLKFKTRKKEIINEVESNIRDRSSWRKNGDSGILDKVASFITKTEIVNSVISDKKIKEFVISYDYYSLDAAATIMGIEDGIIPKEQLINFII